MAITVSPYGQFLQGLGNAEFNFDTDAINVALFQSTYVPNLDTDATFDDISSHEVYGDNYPAGGLPVPPPLQWTYDPATTSAVLHADPVVFANVRIVVRYAALYKLATSSGPRLIGLIDLGEEMVLDYATLPLSFDDGYVRIAALPQ